MSDDTGQIDPTTDLAVRTIYGEGADQPAQAQQAMILTALNRARASGVPIAQQLTASGQYQAWDNPTLRAKMTALSQSDPEYQAILSNIAPALSGQVTSTATNYLNRNTTPVGSSALSTWAAKPGTKLGAQEFYGPNGVPAVAPQTAGLSDSSIDALVGGAPTAAATPAATSPTAAAPMSDADVDSLVMGGGVAPTPAQQQAITMTPAQRAAAAQTLLDANAEDSVSGKAQWPIFDPTNEVGRNQDGSIAFVGKPVQVAKNPDGTVAALAGNNVSDDPKAIAAYLSAHPLDPANQVAARTAQAAAQSSSDALTGDTPDALDKLSLGVGQGLANVSNSIQGADSFIRSNPVGNAFMTGVTGNYVPPAVEDASLAQGVMNRNTNDINNQNSAAYGLGKFGGEVAATLPVMAATGGLAGTVGDAALGGTKFAPALDFVSGQTGGPLLGLRGASLATSGALQGGEASALTSAGSSAPVGQQVMQGAEGGALVGPGIPAAVKIAGAVANKFGAPAISSEAANLADTAINKFGIPLRLGQIAGAEDANIALKDSQSLTKAGTGAAANQAVQRAAFTQAALKAAGAQEPDVAAAISRAGGDPTSATPETMGAIRSALGARYNAIAARTNIALDPQLDADLTRIQNMAGEVGLDTGQTNSINAQIQKIRDAATQNGGAITGKAYQGITDKGSSLSILQNGYGPLGDLANQIPLALNEALTRSASPGDAALLKTTDGYYKNLMTLAPITDVGKTDIAGRISPQLLAARVRTNFSNSAFTGAGDLGDLAQVGQTFMKQPADSKTAARLKDYITGALGAGGLTAEGAALWFHNPAAATGIAGTAAGTALARYGGNMLEGSRFGANAGANAVNQVIRPGANSFLTTPTMQTLGRFANDNYVPATVIGANQFMRPHP